MAGMAATSRGMYRREYRVVSDFYIDAELKDALPTIANFLEASSLTTSINSFNCGVLLLLLTLALWFLYRSQWQRKRSEEHGTRGGRLPPGSSGWPLIGETIEFILDGRKYFRTRRQMYGNIFQSHLCGSPAVVITGAENVQRVLTVGESHLVQCPPSTISRLFGQGSFSSTVGKRHSCLQKCAAKLFSAQNMANFVGPIQSAVRENIARWRSGKGTLNGVETCREMSLSVGYQCLFGFDLDPSEATRIVRLLDKFSNGVFSLPIDLPGFAFHEAMQARNALKSMISQRVSASSRRRSRLSLIDLLFSNIRELGIDGKETDAAAAEEEEEEDERDSDAISDMALELLFASKETTASAMCTALVEIAERPSVLANIRSELKLIGLEPGDLLDHDFVRRKLGYTADVVREVLRVQPPIAGAFRKTCRPFEIQDYVIPAGWMVLYGITATHETSTSFSDPQEFNPDRWKNVRIGRSPADHVTGSGERSDEQTTEAATTRHINRFEYLPFGGGGRRFCVGEAMAKMVLSIFLVEMATWFDGWKLVNGRPSIKTAPIPFPNDSLPIIFKSSDSAI